MGGAGMTHHVLRCWPAYFEAVASGEKAFEIRWNDRNFQRGDTVELVETRGAGRPCRRLRASVGCVVSTFPALGTSRPAFDGRGYVVFSLSDVQLIDPQIPAPVQEGEAGQARVTNSDPGVLSPDASGSEPPQSEATPDSEPVCPVEGTREGVAGTPHSADPVPKLAAGGVLKRAGFPMMVGPSKVSPNEVARLTAQRMRGGRA